MKKLTPALFVAAMLAAPTAHADPTSDGDLTVCWVPDKPTQEAAECPAPPEPEVCKPKPKLKKKRKWKKRKKPVPCACDKGEKGDKGDPGETGIAFIIERPVLPNHSHPHSHDDSYLQLGLGWMGSAFWPANSYAWEQGPSLRLTSGLRGDRSTNLEIGWAPGRAGGVMARATVTDWNWLSERKWLGFGGGLFYQAIGTDPDRAKGHYVGILPEVSLRHDFGSVALSANAGPSLGYAFYDDERETKDFVLGVVGSVGATLSF